LKVEGRSFSIQHHPGDMGEGQSGWFPSVKEPWEKRGSPKGLNDEKEKEDPHRLVRQEGGLGGGKRKEIP